MEKNEMTAEERQAQIEQYEAIIREKLPKVLAYVKEYGFESSAAMAKITAHYGYVQSYKLAIDENRFINLGVEMWVAYKQCIENYDPEKGDFLHYFNRTLSLTAIEATVCDAGGERRQGIVVSKAMIKRAEQIREYCNEEGIDEPSNRDIRIISEIYGDGSRKSYYKYLEAYQQSQRTYVVSRFSGDNNKERNQHQSLGYGEDEGRNAYRNEESSGDYASEDKTSPDEFEEPEESYESYENDSPLYDVNDEGEYDYDADLKNNDGGYGYDDDSSNYDSDSSFMTEYSYAPRKKKTSSGDLDKLEEAFLREQKRSQPKIAAKITYKLLTKVSAEFLLSLNYEFVDKEIVEQFIIDGRILNNEEIAEKLHIFPESLSNTWTRFERKLKELGIIAFNEKNDESN